MKKTVDFRNIKGQEHVKRGLEVAVAGGHNVILIGPKDAPIDEIVRCVTTITPAGQKIKIYTMRPCPCGNFTHPKKECNCTPRAIQKHLVGKLAKVMGKVDIHIDVPALVCDRTPREGSKEFKKRIEQAQAYMRQWRNCPSMDKEADALLKLAIMELGISGMSYDKIEHVARTIAGMDGKDIVAAHHISEAIQYRKV